MLRAINFQRLMDTMDDTIGYIGDRKIFWTAQRDNQRPGGNQAPLHMNGKRLKPLKSDD